MGKLYIVPTPIGNLGDMTLRAIEVLKGVGLILAEDTRKTRILLDHFNIRSAVRSHHKFNEHKTVGRICDEIAGGTDIALVSDAGTPAISDPGFLLVRECIEREIEVETLPGPSAFLPALVNSGIPCDRFCFEGFLPQKKGRQKRLISRASEERTMIFYESPFRLAKTLRQLSDVLGGERKAAVAREITKIYEETARGTLGELADRYEGISPKGEIVIIVEGA